MDTLITVRSAGLVYTNPKAYLRSITAYHPSLVLLGGNECLATFDIGEAVESLDYHTVAARSLDGGETWTLEKSLIATPSPATTHTIRTSRLSDGKVIGFGALHHRHDPEAGLVNRDTFGFVPVDLILVRSLDRGRSWTPPQRIEPPLVGPSWEVCHPIVQLREGRWLAPTATWRGWNGENPSGEQAVVLISDDQGANWKSFGRSFDGRWSGRSHLEQSVIELIDGRILAVSWVYDAKAGKNYPTEYSISEDGGETFSLPMLTGFEAQTCKLIQLAGDDRILAVYRRHDRPGLWAQLARLEGRQWIHLYEASLWQGAESGMTGSAPTGEELSALKFGYPSMKELNPGDVLLLFWCQENCVTHIRWLRLRIR
ncbi:MAG: sialidase family protein [Terriglobia bacterium]